MRVMLVILLLLAVLAGCGKELPSTHAYAVFDTVHGPVGVRVEVANTQEEREQGLMHRGSLPEQAGMLFVFDQEQTVGFWMKNTLIPLDMIMVGEDLRVRHIARNAQPCVADPCEHFYSEEPVSYVVEVNAGFADAHGIGEGTGIQLLG